MVLKLALRSCDSFQRGYRGVMIDIMSVTLLNTPKRLRSTTVGFCAALHAAVLVILQPFCRIDQDLRGLVQRLKGGLGYYVAWMEVGMPLTCQSTKGLLDLPCASRAAYT